MEKKLLENLSIYSKEISSKLEELIILSKLLGHRIKVDDDETLLIFIPKGGRMFIYFRESTKTIEKLIVKAEGKIGDDIINKGTIIETNYARLGESAFLIKIERDHQQMIETIQTIIDVV